MTRVKICGLTTLHAVDGAIAARADYVGFVIFKKSPRHLDIERAKALCAHVEGRARTVVLVVEPTDALLDEIVSRISPDIIQLHGYETPQRVHHIRRRYGRSVWKAVGVATAMDVLEARRFMAEDVMRQDEVTLEDLILYDAKPPEMPDALPGGNGLSFDWRILSGAKDGGAEVKRPFVLAGGLTPENVGTAIKLIDPPIVDVSSGVEREPGTKDEALMQSFIRAAKTAKQYG